MTSRATLGLRWAGGAVVTVALLLLVGFLIFAAVATRSLDTSRTTAEAIVALTGGGQRIETAGQLLRERRANRLFITGVNKVATNHDLMRLTGLSEKEFSCCVDIDREAADTIGNARETAKWLRRKGYKSVIVVTAGYHMPRSLTELARELPEIRLHPYPVQPAPFTDAPWWLQPLKVRTLTAEYVKFLPSAGRFVLARLVSQIAPPDVQDTPPPRTLTGRLGNS